MSPKLASTVHLKREAKNRLASASFPVQMKDNQAFELKLQNERTEDLKRRLSNTDKLGHVP